MQTGWSPPAGFPGSLRQIFGRIEIKSWLVRVSNSPNPAGVQRPPSSLLFLSLFFLLIGTFLFCFVFLHYEHIDSSLFLFS